jgi:hypothetical protein
MIGVVHLVWAPLGPEPLREFVRSYHAHAAGAEHELAIVLNGASAPGALGPVPVHAREALLAELDGTEHRLISLERPVLDLEAYGEAARALTHERLCFLNSYSAILADGWLACLAGALARPGVGLVGASGSWESQAEWRRGRVGRWPQQLLSLPRARRDYPRFPNPHIRTSAFMLERALMLDLDLDGLPDKRSAYLLESGRRSITRRVQEQGLRAVVVGRDGRAHDVEDWPASRTFRSGAQENLLVADNQTRTYQAAAPRGRRRLVRNTWGIVGAAWRNEPGSGRTACQ